MQRSVEAEELHQEIQHLQFEMAVQRQLQVDMITALNNCCQAIYDMQDYMEYFIDQLDNDD